MPLPFDKTLLFIGVKYKLDAVTVLDELFRVFPLYVFDRPPLEYVEKRLEAMIVSKAIIAGKYDLRTYVSFLKKAELMELSEAWDTPAFQDLLYDSDLRRAMDILAMCAFRAEEITRIAKDKYPDLEDIQVLTYLESFCDFRGMSFVDKKNFVYDHIIDPTAQQIYLRCLENRSAEYIRSVLNVSLKTIDPMSLATRSAHISMMKTTQHLASGDDQSLRNYLGINMKSAALLQSLGAGNQSAAEELKKVLAGPSPTVPMKTYTLEELESLKKPDPE